ncbi:sensor histidine kinase [Pararobbsia silviterrae]|uniref:histidine kinase n=1 Tax=Pararobbsia silviterrae TaxID=1792498 RepID=A0A494YB56_9BURK|nr:sensor histidine kinase [Pararobbsia silviterrae]RKP59405.1 sensor histidine kinase [Pararobbsia silviterrae]
MPLDAADADALRDVRYRDPFADPTPVADEPRAKSLFGEVLDWMLAPLLLLWPMSLAVTYLVAKSIANQPFDRALEQDTYVLARQVGMRNGVVTLALPNVVGDFLRTDNVDAVFFQVRGPDNAVIGGDATLPPPPSDDERLAPGIVAFRDSALRGDDIRIAYTYVAVPGGTQSALVQVAETLDKRNALANDIIKGVILPQFVILPLAIVLVWFGLSRGLAPLHALQSQIRARRPDDLSPLDAQQAPLEIAPVVTSFNELLTRLEQNVAAQKRFIADAAHQMKTPLAGLRTQAELALRQDVSADVHRCLEQIAASSENAARMVSQLLALARADAGLPARGMDRMSLAPLVRDVVREWFPSASARRIDLGLEAPDAGVEIVGNGVMLRELLTNLIDNAIRYTPAGGSVTIRLREEDADSQAASPRAVIEVEDTGLGIPAHERARVVERFYRILGREAEGSGLGLAIVSEIAAMHQGTLDIADPPFSESTTHPGVIVRVFLPLFDDRTYP